MTRTSRIIHVGTNVANFRTKVSIKDGNSARVSAMLNVVVAEHRPAKQAAVALVEMSLAHAILATALAALVQVVRTESLVVSRIGTRDQQWCVSHLAVKLFAALASNVVALYDVVDAEIEVVVYTPMPDWETKDIDAHGAVFVIRAYHIPAWPWQRRWKVYLSHRPSNEQEIMAKT